MVPVSEKTRAMSEHDAPPVYPEDLASLQRKKIVTVFVYPPILIRSMDWCAYYDGEEERGEYGEGETKEAAIADLLANYLDDEP
jgi:hypothetical protein